MHHSILLALLVTSGLQATLADSPTASFSVSPESFQLGTQFTARCTVGGFDATKYFQYAAIFYVNPSDSRVLKGQAKIDLDVARWTVARGVSPKFDKTPYAPELIDLTILNTGHTAVPPSFEVKMTPASERSRGRYFCKVLLWETSSSTPIESPRSNEWATGAAYSVLPSATIGLTILALLSAKFL